MPRNPLFLTTAIEAVVRAGDVMMARFGGDVHVDKKGTIDLVTEVDVQIERDFRKMIAERFPDHAVLAEVAASVGLDRERAAAILGLGEFGEMVRTEEAYWADQNITGVPAFILGGRMLIPGAQDPEVFIRVIETKVLAAAA